MRLLFAVAMLLGSAASAQQAPDYALFEPYSDTSGLVSVEPARTINLHCTGTKPHPGTPTVILTGGAGAAAWTWRKVQPAVAQLTRVCSWDRAGFGLSDPSPKAQTAAETTADLIRALAAAHVTGPYVVVGHSAGAYETLHFADARRRDVVGMVLAEPSTPDMFGTGAAPAPHLAKQEADDLADQAAAFQQCSAAIRSGPLAPSNPCLQEGAGMPPKLAAELLTRARNPARFETAASYFASFRASSKAIVDPHRRYGSLPLIVLTAGAPDPVPSDAGAEIRAEVGPGHSAWMAAHRAYAALSSRGVDQVVERTGHMMQAQRPDAIVAAINQVLAQTSAD